jgi:hypothetical protein
MRSSLFAISLLTTLVCLTSCRSAGEGKLTEKHALYLNQSLLKEAVPGMARIWSTSIELDSEVESINDLWVDFAPKSEVTLKTALDEILQFIKTKHAVSLSWSEQGGRITIKRQSEAVHGNTH